MTEHRIALQLLDRTPRGHKAREELITALGAVECRAPDADGTFDVCIECESQESALKRVWNAMASSGADDHLVILEHPDIPHHWEHRPATGEAAAG